ncbi:MAG: Na+/H+ antiporter NhaD-like permease [Promethearchaeota archaeon CR_4]|nr:MAG: Na+/H+ antiporter NhaD-like permease [Candidatus Lokiarchaeota archaeon CR_4]
MADVALMVILGAIFCIVIFAFFREKWDQTIIAMFGAILAVFVVWLQPGHATWDVMGVIDLNSVLLILSMQIVISIAEKENIFAYITLRLIRWTRGNQRAFFYLIVTLGTVMASFISNFSISLLFLPIIIKTCRILEIPEGSYVLGFIVTSKIATTMTPFSSGSNIILISELGYTFSFFAIYLLPISLLILVVTLILYDHFYVRKEKKVQPERKLLLLDLISPEVVISNKKRFGVVSGGLILMFVCFIVLPNVPLFVLGFLFGAGLLLVTRQKMSDVLKNVEWNIVVFYTAMFVLFGSMAELGFTQDLGEMIAGIVGNNIIWACILILLLSSAISAPLINLPVILLFLPILQVLGASGLPTEPLAVALILGTNLGGNILPQASPSDILMLKLAKNFKIVNVNYTRLLKVNTLTSLLHLGISLIYVWILSATFG